MASSIKITAPMNAPPPWFFGGCGGIEVSGIPFSSVDTRMSETVGYYIQSQRSGGVRR